MKCDREGLGATALGSWGRPHLEDNLEPRLDGHHMKRPEACSRLSRQHVQRP